MDALRRNENLHTTFLEFRDAKMDYEGIYICSVLNSLSMNLISEAFKPITKPLFTYVMIFND